MARRVLIIGNIHFVDEDGNACDPQIDNESFAIDLKEGEDPNVIGEHFLTMGHLAYTTLMGIDAERYRGKAYTTDELKEKWEVCTEFIGGRVENVWHENEELQLFDSEEEAKEELDDHLRICKMAVTAGHMDVAPARHEFIIRRVM